MPFQIHLNSWGEWLEFIHDRIGKEHEITQQHLRRFKNNKLWCPRHRDRTQFNAYLTQNMHSTVARKTLPIPKVSINTVVVV